MFKIVLLISIVLTFSRACDENHGEEQLAIARQQSDEYFASAFGYTPDSWNYLYYPNTRLPSGKY
jgi:hypothetical protein